jgi:hypothetical protein
MFFEILERKKRIFLGFFCVSLLLVLFINHKCTATTAKGFIFGFSQGFGKKQLRIKNYESYKFEPLRFFGIKPCKLSFFVFKDLRLRK